MCLKQQQQVPYELLQSDLQEFECILQYLETDELPVEHDPSSVQVQVVMLPVVHYFLRQRPWLSLNTC